MSFARPELVVAPQTLGYIIVDMKAGSFTVVGGVYYETRKDAMDVMEAYGIPSFNVCPVLVPDELA